MTAFSTKLVLMTASVFYFSYLSSSFAMDPDNEKDNIVARSLPLHTNTVEDVESDNVILTSPIKCEVFNREGAWTRSPLGDTRVKFDTFNGDQSFKFSQGQTKILIPENGVYSLLATYAWKAIGEGIYEQSPQSILAIELSNSHITDYKAWRNHPYLRHNVEERGTLNYTGFLEKGQKVSVYVGGSENAQYNSERFVLRIEKTN